MHGSDFKSQASVSQQYEATLRQVTSLRLWVEWHQSELKTLETTLNQALVQLNARTPKSARSSTLRGLGINPRQAAYRRSQWLKGATKGDLAWVRVQEQIA